jgi:adenine-specific DNA glycosylase
MRKFVLKEARIVKTPIIEVHLLFTFVVKDFACPHLQVRFISAMMDIGQVHEVDVLPVVARCPLKLHMATMFWNPPEKKIL